MKLEKHKHIKTFELKDLTIHEYHKRYAHNNYYIVERGIERLGIVKVKYGSYRFLPSGEEINYFDLQVLGEWVTELQKKFKGEIE